MTHPAIPSHNVQLEKHSKHVQDLSCDLQLPCRQCLQNQPCPSNTYSHVWSSSNNQNMKSICLQHKMLARTMHGQQHAGTKLNSICGKFSGVCRYSTGLTGADALNNQPFARNRYKKLICWTTLVPKQIGNQIKRRWRRPNNRKTSSLLNRRDKMMLLERCDVHVGNRCTQWYSQLLAVHDVTRTLVWQAQTAFQNDEICHEV